MTGIEDNFLMLSGLQHFAFCRRQWALIHIEQQWNENDRTVHGNILHERAHSGLHEKRGDLIITRSLPVFSNTLKIRGECDIVEWHAHQNGVHIPKYGGTYKPVPIEYKRGLPLKGYANEVQLCAQAMCLEEMLLCEIPKGYLFFYAAHRRQEVVFTAELRQTVITLTKEMHEHFQRGHTPKTKKSANCKSCSLADLCLPSLGGLKSVGAYLSDRLGEE